MNKRPRGAIGGLVTNCDGSVFRHRRFAIMQPPRHILELAHKQGIKAGRVADNTPLDCPWPPELHEEVYAWLSGYSVARLTRPSHRDTR